jgi:transcription antitermination factor NusG
MLAWHALHVKPQSEALVSESLAGRLECFWPHRISHDNRHREYRRPWFPGYVFVRFDWDNAEQRLSVQRVSWVLAILLSSPGEAASIRDDEIESLRILANSRAPIMSHPCLKIGETVRVTKGPLSGIEGKLERFNAGRNLLVLSVEMLGQAVATHVELDVVEPVARRDLHPVLAA